MSKCHRLKSFLKIFENFQISLSRTFQDFQDLKLVISNPRYLEHSLSRTFPLVPWMFEITSVDCINNGQKPLRVQMLYRRLRVKTCLVSRRQETSKLNSLIRILCLFTTFEGLGKCLYTAGKRFRVSDLRKIGV